jgi:hypothetical protein
MVLRPRFISASPEDIVVIDVKTPSGNKNEIKKLEETGVVFKYPVFLQSVTKDSVILKNSASQEETIPADTVFAFINEKPVFDFLPPEITGGVDQRGFFASPSETLSFRTAHPRVSIVGDANSLGLVTTNIGRGRECAREVHAVLQGEEYVPLVKNPIASGGPSSGKISFEDLSAPIEEECFRCLHCGICVQCDECVKALPAQMPAPGGMREEFYCGSRVCLVAECGEPVARSLQRGACIQMVAR